MNKKDNIYPIFINERDFDVGIIARDYIAIKAMCAIITGSDNMLHSHIDGVGDPERISKLAYQYADAFIRQSNETTNEKP